MDVIISRDEIFRRLERLIAAAADRGLRGVLAVARPFFERPANVAYLSNHFPPFPTAMFWGEAQGFGHAAMVIPTHGDLVLLVDTTYRQDLVPIRDVRPAVGRAGLPHLAATIADVLREKGLSAGRIGLVGDDLMPVRMYRDLTTRLPGLVLEPFDDVLARLRMVKSDEELRLHRRAAATCDAGYQGLAPAIRDGATELEVCAAGFAAAMRAGADFVRYVRVYSGPLSAAGARWPQATDRRMRAGELVVLDVVGASRGMQFDVNRTFVVGRRATDRQKRMLEAALAATRAAIATARPGVPARALVTAANRVLEDRGFGAHVGAFIGHGIGYETVEPPLLAADDETPLEAGMVLCVEPGITIPGEEGVRIEEEIIVTDGEPEVITRFPPEQWE